MKYLSLWKSWIVAKVNTGGGHFCHVSLKAMITKNYAHFVKYLTIFVICKNKDMFSFFYDIKMILFKSLNLFMIYTKSLKQCSLHLIFFHRPKLFMIKNKPINIIFILQFACKVTKIVIVLNSSYDEHCGLHR